MSTDEQHLRLISIFQYVVGGLAALFALFPLIHVFIGTMIILEAGRPGRGPDGPPLMIGWMFVLIGLGIIALGWLMAGCMIAAGRFLTQRRHYTYCLVIGGIECLFMPLGTVLGIFTIIILMRDSVRVLFENQKGVGTLPPAGVPPQPPAAE